ncbi:MAG: hypothetical protein LBS62_14120 [Clostridiales bacterium]|nr:hypothetical protein [Clostridiales bacterium]
MIQDSHGAKERWFYPDTFMPDTSDGVSHEAICFLNPSDRDAHIAFTAYYEDKEPAGGFEAVCRARRTNHIRLDTLVNPEGVKLPVNTPYALIAESDIPVFCEYTRVDASVPARAMITVTGL